jgi:hypothetical protein
MKRIVFIFSLLLPVIGASCSTIRAGIDFLLLDIDGRELIKNEALVKNYLETVLLAPEKYLLSGYTRRLFSPQLKKTPVLYHSLYVITSEEALFSTLSFSGTEKRKYSYGAWAINTDTDMKSYISFKYGTNEWEVQEIPVDNGINTEQTIKNILFRIDNTINYYYKDHINDKKDMENCNTALQNTLVENS